MLAYNLSQKNICLIEYNYLYFYRFSRRWRKINPDRFGFIWTNRCTFVLKKKKSYNVTGDSHEVCQSYKKNMDGYIPSLLFSI